MSKGNFTCNNCGCCCGPVPISREERNKIRIFLLKHPDIEKLAKEKPGPSIECVFRDSENGRCLIYSCRPKICMDYRCDTPEWSKESITEVRKHQREANRYGIELINERFGNPQFKNSYDEIWEAVSGKSTVPQRRKK